VTVRVVRSRFLRPVPAFMCLLFLLAATLPVPGPRVPAAEAAPARISLVINGQAIDSDVPPALINDRTLVPVRVCSENLGAKVDWNPESRTVYITLPGVQVTLPVGSPEAAINGVTTKLDVPAQIIQGRTMVPLRFIGEALGASVTWDGASRTVAVSNYQVTNIECAQESEGTCILVHTSGPVDYQVAAAAATAGSFPRLVVDLRPATLALPDQVVPIQRGSVIQVRTGMVSTNPNVSRLVVDLQEAVEYDVERREGGRVLALRIQHKVTRLGYERRPEGRAVVINGTGPLKCETMRLSDPERLVLDIPGVTLSEKFRGDLVINNELIKGVRAGQFTTDPDVVRVVVDLKRDVPFRVQSTAAGVEVYFDTEVTSVSWENHEDSTRLYIHGSQQMAAQVFTLQDPLRLVMDIPNAILGMDRTEFEGDGGMVSRLVAGQFQRDPDVVRIVVHLPYYFGHREVEGPDENTLAIDLYRSALYGRTVAIDPGHGGQDPGAIGPAGTREKTVNLAIARELEALLTAGGCGVIMTRTGDQTVDLDQRVNIVNRSGADCLVSIHCNGFRLESKCGLETYYYTTVSNSRRLAELVHSEVLTSSRLYNRGLKTGKFIILSQTRIPSALVEVGFITNRREEALLNDPNFRRRVAEALYRAITRFLQ